MGQTDGKTVINMGKKVRINRLLLIDKAIRAGKCHCLSIYPNYPKTKAYSMKRSPLFAVAVLTFCMVFTHNAFAQDEHRTALGLGLEWNMNSRENFAGGAVLGFSFNLSHLFAIGLNATYSNNFSGISTIEPAALFRWYILGKSTGLFVQADAGAYLVFEAKEFTPMFMGGLRGGYRLPIGSSFYIEPYGRGGYPFVFGVGVTAGIRI